MAVLLLLTSLFHRFFFLGLWYWYGWGRQEQQNNENAMNLVTAEVALSFQPPSFIACTQLMLGLTQEKEPSNTSRHCSHVDVGSLFFYHLSSHAPFILIRSWNTTYYLA